MVLDENLPTFVLADATDGIKHHATYYLTRSGAEPEPAYSLQHADPVLPNSKNCFAAALFNAWFSEILYGEVLLQPEWTLPTLSRDEIRKNGGIAPPPEPVVPNEFTVQLYNPDLQIRVTRKGGGIVANPSWEFALPQDTFRAPSGSILDRSQHDPAASTTTPKINFAWKKDGRFGNTLTCYMTGKSTDVLGRKRNKEPDITIAVFKSLREIMIYEPNLTRVDIEDPKGLEVVLLLSAAVIREVYFSTVKDPWNLSEGYGRRRSSTTGKSPTPLEAALPGLPPRQPNAAPTGGPSSRVNPMQTPPQSTGPQPPATNLRSQWEIDAEATRLRVQAEAEAREQRRRERERKRAEEEETRRLKKMVEEEEKEKRRQQKKVDKETERLRRLYGNQSNARPPQQPTPAGPQYPPQLQHLNRPTNFPQQQPPPQAYHQQQQQGGYRYPPQPAQSQRPPDRPQVFANMPFLNVVPPTSATPQPQTRPPQQQQQQGGNMGRRSLLDLRHLNLRGGGGQDPASRPNSVW